MAIKFEQLPNPIQAGQIIRAGHVSQSLVAFAGLDAYDINLSGSFAMTGSIYHSGIDDAAGIASSVLVRDNTTGEYYTTGSYASGGGGSGTSGSSGSSGTSGSSGVAGDAGTSGSSGSSGTSGSSGSSGTSGSSGSSGTSGSSGATGDSGTSGSSGSSGTSGSSGVGGVTTAGSNVTVSGAGTVIDPYVVSSTGGGGAGTSGSSGSSGTSGSSGSSGTSGSSGAAGDAGTSGSSGSSGTSGSSGAAGDAGTSGSSGSSGTSGSSGAAGDAGTSGSSGSSGTSGSSGVGGVTTAGSNVTVSGAGTVIDPYIVSSTGGGGTPDTPLTSFQFNDSGDFGGSTMLFDSTNSSVGLNTAPLSNRVLTISSSAGVPIKLDSDQATANRLQFVNANSVGNGVIWGSKNGDDFEIQQTDTTLQLNTYISRSGEVYLPRLSEQDQQHIIAYDETEGQLTFVSSSLYKNDIVDTQFLDDQGTVTLTGTTSLGVQVSGSAYIILSGSDTGNTNFNFVSPSGVYGGDGIWSGLNIRYHDRGFNTTIRVFDSTDRPPNTAGSQVGFRTLMVLKESGFYALNATQTGLDGQLEFGVSYGSGSALPDAPLRTKQTNAVSISPGATADYEIVSTYEEANITTTGAPSDTLTFKGGRTGRPILPGTVVTVRLDITTSTGFLNTQFWDGDSSIAIESNITGTPTKIYSFVSHDYGDGQGLMLLNNLTVT